MTSILKVVAVAAEMLNPDPAAVEAHNQATLTAHETHGNFAIEMTTNNVKNAITNTDPIIKFEDAVNPAKLSEEPGIEPDPEPQDLYNKPIFEGHQENIRKAHAILEKYDGSEKIETWVQSDFGHNPTRKSILTAKGDYKIIFAEYSFMAYYFYWVAGTYITRRTYDKSLSSEESYRLQSVYHNRANRLRKKLSELNRTLNPPEQVLIPEADKIGVCTIDNKSAEVLAAEKRMGIEITTKVYSETDIDYIIARNGKKIVAFTSAGSTKSYEIYTDEEGSLIFDKIMIKDGLHWYTKFRENNGVIEKWYMDPTTSGWEKGINEYPMSANSFSDKTTSLPQ